MNYSESKRIEATCRACDMIEAALPECPTVTDWGLIEMVSRLRGLLERVANDYELQIEFDRSDNLGDEIKTALAESARLMRQARGGNATAHKRRDNEGNDDE